MTQLSLPGARDGDSDNDDAARSAGESPDSARGAQHDGARRAKMHVASEEECLAALSQLARLLLMGVITTSQANSARATYTSILQHHQKRRAGNAGQSLDQAGLVDAVRKNPEIANLLEPLLTDDQITMILKQAQDSSNHGSD